MELVNHIWREPVFLLVWTSLVLLVNLASVGFVRRHAEARFILAAVPATFALAWWLFTHYGCERFLPLSHLIIWVPVLIIMIWRNPDVDFQSRYKIYLTLVFLINLVTFGLDALDLYHHLAGSAALA